MWKRSGLLLGELRVTRRGAGALSVAARRRAAAAPHRPSERGDARARSRRAGTIHAELSARCCAHYGMEPTTNTAGHGASRTAMSSSRTSASSRPLIRRCGCGAAATLPTAAAYERFLAELVRQRNLTRTVAWPRSRRPCARCRHAAGLHAANSRSGCRASASIQVLRNHLLGAVALIGTTLKVRVRAETARALSWHGASADAAASVSAQPASDRLPPPDLVAGAQAGRLRELLLPRGPVSDHHLPPGLRRAARGDADQGRPRVPAAAAPGREHLGSRSRAGARRLLLDSGRTPTFDAVRDSLAAASPSRRRRSPRRRSISATTTRCSPRGASHG